MVFEWDGMRYDTASMKSFNTGARHEPVIYVTRDGRCVFVQTMDRSRGVAMHRASASEIRRLAQQHGIPELLQALETAEDPEACRAKA